MQNAQTDMRLYLIVQDTNEYTWEFHRYLMILVDTDKLFYFPVQKMSAMFVIRAIRYELMASGSSQHLLASPN